MAPEAIAVTHRALLAGVVGLGAGCLQTAGLDKSYAHGSYCALSAPAAFCDDFDSGRLDPAWVPLVDASSSIGLVSGAGTKSPPASLRARVGAGSSQARAAVRRQLGGPATEAHLAFDLHLVQAGAHGAKSVVAQIFFGSADASPWDVRLYATDAALLLQEADRAGNDETYNDARPAAALPVDRWVRVAIEVVASSCDVSIDGAPAATLTLRAPALSLARDMSGISLGSVFTQCTNDVPACVPGDWELWYDDVTYATR